MHGGGHVAGQVYRRVLAGALHVAGAEETTTPSLSPDPMPEGAMKASKRRWMTTTRSDYLVYLE